MKGGLDWLHAGYGMRTLATDDWDTPAFARDCSIFSGMGYPMLDVSSTCFELGAEALVRAIFVRGQPHATRPLRWRFAIVCAGACRFATFLDSVHDSLCTGERDVPFDHRVVFSSSFLRRRAIRGTQPFTSSLGSTTPRERLSAGDPLRSDLR